MSHSAARARPDQDRVSLYEEITNKIITELEAGRLPWVQPWGSNCVSGPLTTSLGFRPSWRTIGERNRCY
jgi:antirestriction protein ArdC